MGASSGDDELFIAGGMYELTAIAGIGRALNQLTF